MLSLAVLGMVPLAVPSADAADADSPCTLVRDDRGVEIEWQAEEGWPVVRRDGRWLASPGGGATSYTDIGAPAGSEYSIRYWADDNLVVDLDCTEVEGDDDADCVATREGSIVTIRWEDAPGNPVVRRDGQWLASPGRGVTTHVDDASPPGSTYSIRFWLGIDFVDVDCEAGDEEVASCQLEWIGSNAVLTWNDLGGSHVVRHDGDWVATPGVGSSSYTVSNAREDGVYDVRTWYSGGVFEDRICVETVTERVIWVSIDGLRSDHVTLALMPNLTAMVDNGAATLNARTDYDVSKTLPNHTSQLTGRYVVSPWGHQLSENQDADQTVHQEAGFYVASVFDVVHDHGGGTAVFAGKEKFEVIERSWNAQNGAVDTVGANDGRDKIDVFERDDPAALVEPMLQLVEGEPGTEFVLFHIRYPDAVGHLSGWGSPQYDLAVEEADAVLGLVLDGLDDRGLTATTSIIVTSDHGGPDIGLLHDDPTKPETYTVPFVVTGPGVAVGTDLYDLNTHRVDPGNTRPDHVGPQPIRTTELANLVTDLLGLPTVDGSVVGAVIPLKVG